MRAENTRNDIRLEAQRRREYAGEMTDIAHPALQFCWHVRVGFYRQVESDRIWDYVRFFYRGYLALHLDRQQKRLAACTGVSERVWRETILAHRRLHRLFVSAPASERTLGRIEEQLEAFVRFEKNTLLQQTDLLRGESPKTHRVRCELLFDVKLAASLETWPDRFWELL